MRTVGGWVLGTRYDAAPTAADLAGDDAKAGGGHGSASGPATGGAEAATPTLAQDAGAALAGLPLPAQLLCLSIVLNSSASLAAEAPPSKARADGSLRARCRRCLGRCSCHLGRHRQAASPARGADADGDSAAGRTAAVDQAHVAITLASKVGASGKGGGGVAATKGRGDRAAVPDAREQTVKLAAAPAAAPYDTPSHASAGGRGDGSGLHAPMLSPNSRYAAHQHDTGDAADPDGGSGAGDGADTQRHDDAGDPFPQAPSRFVGNVTEGALLLWLRSHLGVDYEPLRGAAAGGDESEDEDSGGGGRDAGAGGADVASGRASHAAAERPAAGSGDGMGAASPARSGRLETATPASSGRSGRRSSASGAGGAVQQVHRQPFDSQRKTMATVLRVGGRAADGAAAEGAGRAAGGAESCLAAEVWGGARFGLTGACCREGSSACRSQTEHGASRCQPYAARAFPPCCVEGRDTVVSHAPPGRPRAQLRCCAWAAPAGSLQHVRGRGD